MKRVRIERTVREALIQVGSGFQSLLSDREQLTRLVLGITAVLAAGFASREGAKLIRQQLAAILGRPSLVRETSRITPLRPMTAAQTLATRFRSTNLPATFGDVVLNPELQDRVLRIAEATKNTKKNRAPFRHICFYGPPGTGKTFVARKLAYFSGLDYAIMSGGDVMPLGKDAVTQIHRLFEWAQKSPRGVLLFIDEAEAFLAQRTSGMSEPQRNALNAMLFQTGTQSKNFMLVLATNRPGDLDAAVVDRIDEMVEFPLPTLKERSALCRLYFDIMLAKPPKTVGGSRIQLHGIEDQHLDEIALQTEGYSGRAISKLMISIQGHV